MTTIIAQNRKLLGGSPKVVLYEFDFSTCLTPIDSVLYMSPYNDDGDNLVFGGQEYQWADIGMSGLTTSLGGTMMSPTLTFTAGSPADQMLTVAIQGGLRGMRVTRKSTRACFLDNGEHADPNEYTAMRLFVNGLEEQTKTSIKVNLTPAYGIEGINDIANRTMQYDQCMLKYRVPKQDGTFIYTEYNDGGCPWGNANSAALFPEVPSFGTPYFNANNEEVVSPTQDRCSLNTQGCMKRFPVGNLPIEAKLKQATKNC